jgi:hypothetical protein
MTPSPVGDREFAIHKQFQSTMELTVAGPSNPAPRIGWTPSQRRKLI